MDHNIWITISFITCLAISYKSVKKVIFDSINTKIEEIKTKLNKAQEKEKEAKAMLEKITKEMDNLSFYKKNLIHNAKESISAMIITRTKKMDLMLIQQREYSIQSIENIKSKVYYSLSNKLTIQVEKLLTNYLYNIKDKTVINQHILNSINKIVLK